MTYTIQIELDFRPWLRALRKVERAALRMERFYEELRLCLEQREKEATTE